MSIEFRTEYDRFACHHAGEHLWRDCGGTALPTSANLVVGTCQGPIVVAPNDELDFVQTRELLQLGLNTIGMLRSLPCSSGLDRRRRDRPAR